MEKKRVSHKKNTGIKTVNIILLITLFIFVFSFIILYSSSLLIPQNTIVQKILATGDTTKTMLQYLYVLYFKQEPELAPPPGFVEVPYVTGLSNPTAMEFSPDGRLFIAEQAGNLKIYDQNGNYLSTFLTAPVTSSYERGLLGVAFDPNFTTNRYIYVYYTASGTNMNRVSRFRASSTNPNVVESGSELQILNTVATPGYHNGGAIHFGNDGMLYIGVGDGHSSSSAQNLDSLGGKMLRINPNNYPNIAPTDNPFYTGSQSDNRGKVWAYGFRNPFTFAVDPATGRIYVNDVGQDNWEEINNLTRAGNYGWPDCEGNSGICSAPRIAPLYTYSHSNGCAITGGVFYRGNTFPQQYNGSYFFADFCGNWIRRLDSGGNLVSGNFASGGNMNGVVDFKVGPDGSLYFLSYYNGAVYKISYQNTTQPTPTNTIVCEAEKSSITSPMAIGFDSQASNSSYIYSTVSDVTNIPPIGTGAGILNITVPVSGNYYVWTHLNYPQGSVGSENSYWLQIDNGPYFKVGNEDYPDNIWHWVDFHEGNQVNRIIVNLTAGNRSIKFLGREANTKIDRILLTPNSTYIPFGLGPAENCTLATQTSQPQNQPPIGNILSPLNGSKYNGGQIIFFNGTGNDTEDGLLPASSFKWVINFHHHYSNDPNAHTHPFMTFNGIKNGSFQTDQTGHTADDVWYRINLTVNDSQGATHSSYVDIIPNKINLTITSVPVGLKITLDGQPFTSPIIVTSVVGVNRTIGVISPQNISNANYTFSNWSDNKPAIHEITTPSINTIYTAYFNLENPGCGNGILEIALGEQCDDGNTNNGDGCSSTCQIEQQLQTSLFFEAENG
ncbi:MAG: PQQ-dependent sugar dehydrogenase, partial [Candidatus Pacearchaeota archaeon]